MIRVLVHGEAGRVGRDLEEHAAGLSEVDRMEVLSVENRGDVEAPSLGLTAPGLLRLVVRRPPCDVVRRPDRGLPRRPVGYPYDVHEALAPGRGVPGAAVLLPDLLEAQEAREEVLRPVGRGFEEGDAGDLAYRVLLGDGAPRPPGGGCSVQSWPRDDLDSEPVRVLEGEDGLVEAARGGSEADAVLDEALRPVSEGVLRHREGGRPDLSRSAPSARRPGPGEERHDRTGGAASVAVIEVV